MWKKISQKFQKIIKLQVLPFYDLTNFQNFTLFKIKLFFASYLKTEVFLFDVLLLDFSNILQNTNIL